MRNPNGLEAGCDAVLFDPFAGAPGGAVQFLGGATDCAQNQDARKDMHAMQERSVEWAQKCRSSERVVGEVLVKIAAGGQPT